MGKVIDSTNVIGSSIKRKARLDKNLSKDNYYLKMLQDKIDYEWYYRYNVVDIEEEKAFGSEQYKPIEVVIQSVYSEKERKTLSDDWRKIIFRDIKYPTERGGRYKFSLDFDNPELQDIDKSIWLTVNDNSTAPDNGIILRRCDTNVVIVSQDGTDIHREPAIIEDDFKYVNFYYDETITIAQAEIYLIMQYNKYTKNIVINDRFIIGPVDLQDKQNNQIFRVKAIRKFRNSSTFKDGDEKIIFLALDKDDLGPQEDDDLRTRVVVNSPYYIKEELEDEHTDKQYHIEVVTQDNDKYDSRLLLNKKRDFSCCLYNENDERIDVDFDITVDLLSTDNDIYYYEFIKKNSNEFSIYNKKMYIKDKLKISCQTTYNNQNIEKVFYIELGGNT